MAKIHFNISDALDEEMRNYIEKNNLTITTFLHLAVSKYLATQKQQDKLQKIFTEFLEEEFKKK